MREEQLRTLREEKLRKQKEAARKIAPGFLDTDRRILTPVNTQRRSSQQGDAILTGVSENGLVGKNTHERASSNDEVSTVGGYEKVMRDLETFESITLIFNHVFLS